MSEEKIEFGSESDSFDNEEKQRTYTYQSDRQRAYTMNRKNSSFAVDLMVRTQSIAEMRRVISKQ